MKIEIWEDELYPCYGFLLREGEGSYPGRSNAELSSEEIEEYERVDSAWKEWQDKLENLYETRTLNT